MPYYWRGVSKFTIRIRNLKQEQVKYNVVYWWGFHPHLLPHYINIRVAIERIELSSTLC